MSVSPQKKRRSAPWFAIVAALVSITAAGAAVVILAELKLTRLVPGGLGESFSTRIYAAPFELAPDRFYSLDELTRRLERAGYRRSAPAASPQAGEFRWDDPALTINLRGFTTPILRQEPGVFRMIRGSEDRWKLVDMSSHPLDGAHIEPELAAELSGPNKVRRDPAAWDEYPQSLVHAVVAVEDRRFFTHHGLDGRSIGRAFLHNIRNRRRLQGGSTITQQLAKNLFLTHKRTFRRKLVEAALAVYLDFRYSKEKILTLYLNQIYMGQDGFVSVAGVKAAAGFYFSKALHDLTLSESATLAGLIRSPYRYNPLQNEQAARERRDTVLSVMRDVGYITAEEAEAAKREPISKVKRVVSEGNSSDNDYFAAEVVRRILPRYNEDMLFRYGLKIHTTLDPVMQAAAQKAVRLTKRQAALVAIDAGSGRVMALVGGKQYRESQFNRASQAMRQPGSAFKPFVYGAALETGLTPATIIRDEPRAFTDGTKVWAPQNFDRAYHGDVTMRLALSTSLNGATLDLAQRIGTPTIIKFARKLGVSSPLDKSLAIALGVSEVTPLELTAAYAPFANGGFQIEPYLVTAVFDAADNLLEVAAPERVSVLDPALAYLMTSLLETTVTGGTAQGLAGTGWTHPTAGKTGTTNEGKDAWFIGYTAELLTGVWVGDDEGKSMNFSGSKNALPIWASFMTSVAGARPKIPFEKPTGVTTTKIDPTTGLLARSGCPTRSDEMFVAGTEPTRSCSIHAGGIKGLFQRMFKKKVEIPPSKPRPRN